MKTKLIRQRARVIKCCGVDEELTMGYIVVERQFKVYKDGHMRLDDSYSERLIRINGKPINCLWNEVILEEFFPGFNGYEVVGEI